MSRYDTNLTHKHKLPPLVKTLQNIVHYQRQCVENKVEILVDFFLKITQYDFTKRGGRDEALIKSLS